MSHRIAIVAVGVAGVLALLFGPLHAAARHAPATKHACKTTSPRHRAHILATNTSQPVITFGITGGNIQPWSVSLDGDGSVSATGWMKVRNHTLVDPASTLTGLFKLADADSFFSLPTRTNCSGVLPDIATRYIWLNSRTGSHQVAVRGGCSSRFNQLYAALENTVDIQH